MAVRSGFWNSVGTDIRTYYNDDFSHLISLLINDGIHQNYGKNFVVKPGSGMEVIVQTGEAWFNNSWIRSDSDLPTVVDTPPIVSGFKRIDAIAIKIDASQSVRLGSIEYIKGEETSSTPQQPTLTDTDDIHWHLLATILVSQNDTEISASKITNYVGTSSAPFITGILETVNIDTLLSQWSSQFDNWMNGQEVDFMEWFDHIKGQLSEDAAGHLQEEVDALDTRVTATETGKQDKTDNALTTVAKTIVGAINELLSKFASYYTKTESDNLLANKTNTKVKGSAESSYRTGNVNITKANIGLGNVDNTADANKSVANARTWNGAINDMSTNNTTDTWVPVVAANNKIQHRIIPTTLLYNNPRNGFTPCVSVEIGFDSTLSPGTWIYDMNFADGSKGRIGVNGNGMYFAEYHKGTGWHTVWVG